MSSVLANVSLLTGKSISLVGGGVLRGTSLVQLGWRRGSAQSDREHFSFFFYFLDKVIRKTFPFSWDQVIGNTFPFTPFLGLSHRKHFSLTFNFWDQVIGNTFPFTPCVGSSDQGPFPLLLPCICISGPIAYRYSHVLRKSSEDSEE